MRDASAADAPARPRWAPAAHAVGAATLALFVALGLRPGAPLGPWLYLQGTSALFAAGALVLVLGLVSGLRRPPLLARGRGLPLGVLAGSLFVLSLPFPYPSSHATRPSAVRFRLPCEGAWRVRWGGERAARNALAYSPARRYGFALVPDEQGEEGRAVLAPCDATVIAAQDELRDGADAGRTPFGNHAVLAVAPGEYLVLANLRQGSLVARPGESVRAGQVLARLGDSAAGSTRRDAALLVHLQDAPAPGRGEGIPMRFHGYVSGGRAIEAGVPEGAGGGAPGDRVEPLAPR